MNSIEFRDVIAALAITQSEFADLVGVSPGAVSQWITDTRGIPGPVVAFVSLLLRLPESIRAQEISFVRKRNTLMKNGMYLVHFKGVGDGYATLTFKNGAVYGFDVGGNSWDGVIVPSMHLGFADIKLQVHMKGGMATVAGGIVKPFDWTMQVSAQLPVQSDEADVIVTTDTGFGINAHYKYMRALPLAA